MFKRYISLIYVNWGNMDTLCHTFTVRLSVKQEYAVYNRELLCAPTVMAPPARRISTIAPSAPKLSSLHFQS